MKYIILSTLLLFFTAKGVWAEVLIITNKSVGEKALSSKDIKNIFLGNTQKWQDLTTIYFVILDDDNIHPDFLKSYINKTPSQFKAYWRNRVFSGKGEFPKELKTSSEIVDYVANTKGAIGYINSNSPATNVNTISVEQ